MQQVGARTCWNPQQQLQQQLGPGSRFPTQAWSAMEHQKQQQQRQRQRVLFARLAYNLPPPG